MDRPRRLYGLRIPIPPRAVGVPSAGDLTSEGTVTSRRRPVRPPRLLLISTNISTHPYLPLPSCSITLHHLPSPSPRAASSPPAHSTQSHPGNHVKNGGRTLRSGMDSGAVGVRMMVMSCRGVWRMSQRRPWGGSDCEWSLGWIRVERSFWAVPISALVSEQSWSTRRPRFRLRDVSDESLQ